MGFYIGAFFPTLCVAVLNNSVIKSLLHPGYHSPAPYFGFDDFSKTGKKEGKRIMTIGGCGAAVATTDRNSTTSTCHTVGSVPVLFSSFLPLVSLGCVHFLP